MNKEIVITIDLPPVTKKNSQQIVVVRGRRMLIPSKKYRAYEKACRLYVHGQAEPIDEPVNVKCVYYMPTHRRVDLLNLLASTLDILVKYGVLADDNSNIVVGHDGSKVEYDKERPRTIITISPVER